MKRLLYTIFIIFLFMGSLSYSSSAVYAVDFCPEIKGKFNPGDIVCVGDGSGNRQICQDVSGDWVPYTPSCGHDNNSTVNNGDLCDDANPAVCKAVSTPTPVPTGAAGDKDCIVTIIGPDNINPPVTMKSGTAKCINNVATTCNNGNKTFFNCTNQSGGCQEINASTATCTGPTPTPNLGPNPTATPAPGYWIPQPGYNCGRIVGDPLGDDVSTSCCNSAIASWGEFPVDAVEIGPFNDIPLFDKVKAFILQGVSSSIDKLPLPIDPFNISSKIPFSVKNLKKAVNSVPVCLPGGKPTADRKDPSCKCVQDPTQPNPALTNLSSLCAKLINSDEKDECTSCVWGKDNKFGGGIWTGLGCINVSENGFINSAINIGIGLGGGFALMCIIYAAFLLQTSGGSPEAIKKARELMTSCITGLILIIFSVFILRVIGYDILKLPGFGN